jgi:hypothetical protein
LKDADIIKLENEDIKSVLILRYLDYSQGTAQLDPLCFNYCKDFDVTFVSNVIKQVKDATLTSNARTIYCNEPIKYLLEHEFKFDLVYFDGSKDPYRYACQVLSILPLAKKLVMLEEPFGKLSNDQCIEGRAVLLIPELRKLGKIMRVRQLETKLQNDTKVNYLRGAAFIHV